MIVATGEELSVTEHHYTVQEVGELWHLSEDVVRKMFEDEPGVFLIGNADSTRRRRRYVTLRIPESVLRRVYRRYLNLRLKGDAA